MSITARRVHQEVTISGSTQSETTGAIMGRIDQLIINSTRSHSFDLSLTNMHDEIFCEKKGMHIDGSETISDLRPQRLPMGTVKITVSNPVPASGTITFTFIEKERES